MLRLSRCYRLNDVNELGNIHTLMLSRYNNLEDISKLNNNYQIELSSCPRISNYEALTKSVIVKLDDQNSVDMPVFLLTRKLEISKCRKVKSRSGLKFTVKVLTLNGPYKSMFRGNTFESCVSVEISDCQSCLDLEIFHRTRSLALNFCDKISSLAGLRKLKLEYVAIRHCRNITDFSPLCVVPHVCLSLHSNEYTQRLGISQALTFTSFQGLQDVKTLEIHNVMSNQLYLTPLLLGNNETLIISNFKRARKS
jgi:hypothetical protein